MLQGEGLLALSLLEAGGQQMAVVRDCVVAVLVQRAQQLLQALLHAVSLQLQSAQHLQLGSVTTT